LDYYTGFVFECFDPDDRDLGSIVGGGRFDGLVGIYGRECPAVGCAGGLARLILSLESKHLIPSDVLPVPQVYIAPVTQSEMPQAMSIAAGLRKAGVATVVGIMGRKLTRSLEVANRAGHPYALIVGKRDLETGQVTVREMQTGKEVKTRVEDVASMLLKLRS
jgi:histidyl-tRNA synthetase